MVVYDKSILWAVHDLFERGWKRKDFTRYRLPVRTRYPIRAPWNRAILGVERLVADLESAGVDRLDRGFGGSVSWAHTDELVSIGGSQPRVWTGSTTHGGFDSEPITVESIKLLLK